MQLWRNHVLRDRFTERANSCTSQMMNVVKRAHLRQDERILQMNEVVWVPKIHGFMRRGSPIRMLYVLPI
jgi:hypothetical protein